MTIKPDSGLWVGAKYTFSFQVPDNYPHTPPKVTCSPKIYHPNINYQGAVCLNILREDWKPVLDINAVIYGLIYLFYEPNPDDPLNREAADLFRNDKAQVCYDAYIHCLCIVYSLSLDSLAVLSRELYKACPMVANPLIVKYRLS